MRQRLRHLQKVLDLDYVHRVERLVAALASNARMGFRSRMHLAQWHGLGRQCWGSERSGLPSVRAWSHEKAGDHDK